MTSSGLLLSPFRQVALMLTLSLSAFSANYVAAAHLIALFEVAEAFHVSLKASADTIGFGLLGLGTAPFLWNPLSAVIGKRTTYLLAWFLFLLMTIWIALSTSYASFSAARFFAAFTGGVAQSLPAIFIAERIAERWRGSAVACWTLFMIGAATGSPVIGAAFLTRVGWRWLYYFTIILVGFNGFLLWIFLPRSTVAKARIRDTETKHFDAENVFEEKSMFEPSCQTTSVSADHTAPSRKERVMVAIAKNSRVFLRQAIRPLRMLLDPTVVLVSLYCAMLFGWAVGVTLIVPEVYELPPYNYSKLAVGGFSGAGVVGLVIGKFAGGYLADVYAIYKQRQSGQYIREQRLWACVPHFLLYGLGLLIFGIGLQNHWPWPAPIIAGFGVLAFSLVAALGILQTYMIECNLEATIECMAIFNFAKNTFAFACPFFLPGWAFSGFTKAYVVQAVLSVFLGLLLCTFLLFRGRTVTRRDS
ncbi:MFS general substrate transporter [Acaromyces ingoldii]|uniref:MFS general substrate transporter n=1 Tax=Acaromyces ingoldii TaxID=215250 RepID=A0A316YG89_9BASI|nr:MFS general substrate transporter [Acaromyces ingoldii]PWN86765.1 MFS general substrate transporter [Acaromyces ingoldii]